MWAARARKRPDPEAPSTPMEIPGYAERLRLGHRITEPAIREAISSLGLPPGSRGLDAGCGIGRHSLWLAEAVGPAGHVVGLDISPEHLAVGRCLAQEAGNDGFIHLVAGDVGRLPFVPASFDWIWSADTLWPGFVTRDPAASVRELARLVRAGGRVAFTYCTGQSLLPGHPVLEARLNLAFAQSTPYLAGIRPVDQVLRALGWLEAAGLGDLSARTCVAEIEGPLSLEQRDAVAFWCDMLWGQLEGQVAAETWSAFQGLCGAGAEAPLFAERSYYGFVTYTCFAGRVPAD